MDIVIDAICICLGLRMRWDPYFILVQIHLKVYQRPKSGSPQTSRKKNKSEKNSLPLMFARSFLAQFTGNDKAMGIH